MATTRDPFKDIPAVPPSALIDDTEMPSHVQQEDARAIEKGTAPKGLLSQLGKWSMIVGFSGVLIWVFFAPNNASHSKKIEQQAPVSVDQVKQTSDTNALLTQLQEQAQKAPPAVPPAPAAGVAGTAYPAPNGVVQNPFTSDGRTAQQYVQANGVQSAGSAAPQAPGAARPYNPLAMSQAQIESAQSAEQVRLKREEEIRASPTMIQANIKLLGEGTTPSAAAKSNLDQLHEELAAVNAAKGAAAQGQTDATNRLLSGLNTQPAPPEKTKGANEQFLADQAQMASTPKVLQVQPPVSQWMIQENTIIRSVLLNDISSDLPGKINAMVTTDVYDSIYRRHILIPKGSVLVGAYSTEVVVGQEVLLFAMTRLILPNGNWIPLGGATATNMIGQSGIPADVNNHFVKMFSTSFILGASSLLLPSNKTSVQTTTNGSGNLTTGSVAGLALNDALTNMMSRNKNIAPTLTTGHGIEFMFMVAQDMAMPPYRH